MRHRTDRKNGRRASCQTPARSVVKQPLNREVKVARVRDATQKPRRLRGRYRRLRLYEAEIERYAIEPNRKGKHGLERLHVVSRKRRDRASQLSPDAWNEYRKDRDYQVSITK